MAPKSLLPLLAVGALLGCGGQVSGSEGRGDGGGDATMEDGPGRHDAFPPPSGDSPAPPDAPTLDAPASGDGGTPWSPVCPETRPSMGAPCTLKDVSCEYACGDVLVCADGSWGGAVGSFFC